MPNSAPKAKAKKKPNDLEDRVALQFADRYAEHFRFIAKWGRWMLWNGIHWQHEDTLAAFDKARVLCRTAEDAKAKTVARRRHAGPHRSRHRCHRRSVGYRSQDFQPSNRAN